MSRLKVFQYFIGPTNIIVVFVIEIVWYVASTRLFSNFKQKIFDLTWNKDVFKDEQLKNKYILVDFSEQNFLELDTNYCGTTEKKSST